MSIEEKIKEEIKRQTELAEIYREDGAPHTARACLRCVEVLKRIITQ